MMTQLYRCIVISCALTLACAGVNAQSLQEKYSQEPKREDWFLTDVSLKASVTIEANLSPLKTVLKELSKQTHVTLEVSPRLQNIRMTLPAQTRTLSETMLRIQDLFHHGVKLSDYSTYWKRVQNKDGAIRYVFTQSSVGIAAEEDEKDLVYRTLEDWLRSFREYASLDPKKKKKFKTKFKTLQYHASLGETLDEDIVGPITEVLGSMTDDEIRSLARTGKSQVANFNPPQEKYDSIVQTAKRTQHYHEEASGMPFGAPILTFEQDNVSPARYYLWMNISSGPVQISSRGGINFDTKDSGGVYAWTLEEIDAIRKEEKATPIDLLRDQKKIPGKIPVFSLSKRLQLWSKVAGKNILCEQYLGEKHQLQTTIDKPETLLTIICYEFGYDWRRIGNDYLVFSKSWANERTSDITDETLDRWRTSLQRDSDHIHTAIEMSDLKLVQLNVLSRFLGVYCFRNLSNYYTVQLLKGHDSSEFKQALSTSGTLLNSNTASRQTILAKLFPNARNTEDATIVWRHELLKDRRSSEDISVKLKTGEEASGYITLGPETKYISTNGGYR